MISKEQFLELSIPQIREVLLDINRPRLGVFVPDGTRRLVIAYSDLKPNTPEFYRYAAELPAGHLRESIQTFFNYGLPSLIVPILGRSVLSRGNDYQQYTLLHGLRLLFHSKEWSEFYQRNQVRVRVFGHKEQLIGTFCEEALEWINETEKYTEGQQLHLLLYGIGESPIVGEEAAWSATQLYKQNHCSPSREELIRFYYGELLPSADFFIMTSKMSGMCALPNLLVDGDTEIYYLPTMTGLNDETYRLILYDILFERSALRSGIAEFDITPENRAALRRSYEQLSHQIIGLGFSVGKIWVMKQGE